MNRTHIIFTVILAVLLALFFIDRQKEEKQVSKSISSETEPLFASFDNTSVSVISITENKTKKQVTLKKEHGKWVVSNYNYPADESAVEQLLAALKSIRKGRKLSSFDDEARKKYLFDSAGVTVSVAGKTIQLGKAPDGSFTPLVVDNVLYYSPFRESWKVIRSGNEWRNRNLLFGVSKETIASVAAKLNDKKSVSFDIKDGKVVDGTVSGITKENADKMVENLLAMSIASFPENDKDAVPYREKTVNGKTTKEPIDRVDITITDTHSRKITLSLTGKKKPKEDELYVTKDGSLYTILSYRYNQITDILKK